MAAINCGAGDAERCPSQWRSVRAAVLSDSGRGAVHPLPGPALVVQVGCAMNCQFCYTGRMGLLGNLSTAQIVEQVVEVSKRGRGRGRWGGGG